MLAANNPVEPAVPPNDAGVVAEPNRPPDVVGADGVPNANGCDDGVPNENPPIAVPPAVADVVEGVPNWKPPDIMTTILYDSNTYYKMHKLMELHNSLPISY